MARGRRGGGVGGAGGQKMERLIESHQERVNVMEKDRDE